MAEPAARLSLWDRLGLGRPELRAWAMYDWANSAFSTTIMVAVFPIYYKQAATAGLMSDDTADQRFSLATTIALTVVALSAPLLGVLADLGGLKKKLLAAFQGLGVLATAGMFFIYPGDWMLALGLFMLANIGIAGAFVFYDSLLPHITRPGEMERVSSAGYALGYVGGGVLLALNALWIMKPAWFGLRDAGLACRVSFLSVAVWWVVFSIPLFRRVPEPRPAAGGPRPSLGRALAQLGRTLGHLRRYKHAFLMLLAFMVYNDGIATIMRMATVYGTTLKIESGHLIAALLLVQFVGIPCTFAFGALAGRIGAKPAVYLGLAVYLGISVLGYFMTSALHFYLLAGLVGLVQGGTQALSRSLFARMIPRRQSSEFFSFFAVFEKFAGIVGPAAFAASIALFGSSRAAILSVIVFFAAGMVLLAKVDVAAGERAAREADAAD